MTLRFLPAAYRDKDLASLIALLHDADDYKLVDPAQPRTTHAIQIMNEAGVPKSTQNDVVLEIQRIGYSNRLAGKTPATMAGKTVSDADMCDIMGATGILRLAEYDIARDIRFFDPDDLPRAEINAKIYNRSQNVTAVRHMFDKILRLPELMLTEKGRAEALIRRRDTIRFLQALFREQHAGRWNDLLHEIIETNIRP